MSTAALHRVTVVLLLAVVATLGCDPDVPDVVLTKTRPNEQTPKPSSPPKEAAPTPSLPDFRGINSNTYFISQMQDNRWNPTGPTWSLNCAPASLAMALKALGKLPPGAKADDDPQALIQKTRLAIDGTTANDQLVLFDDVEKGAVRCGLNATRLYKLPAIQAEMARGRFVILIGDPTVYSRRLSDRDYMKTVGAHSVLLTTIMGSTAWINDPLSRVGNLAISLEELERYIAMNDWYQGISVWVGTE